MKRRVLVGMVLPLSLAFLQPSAFAQAAAESVLLNANSAAATAKAGSALGSTLNRAGKQIGERVQQTVQPAPERVSQAGARPVSTIVFKSPATSGGTAQAEGPMIASVQGAAPTCASTSQPASMPGSKTAAESAQPICSAQNSSITSAPQKYKSVVTVSFPK